MNSSEGKKGLTQLLPENVPARLGKYSGKIGVIMVARYYEAVVA